MMILRNTQILTSPSQLVKTLGMSFISLKNLFSRGFSGPPFTSVRAELISQQMLLSDPLCNNVQQHEENRTLPNVKP